LIAIFTTASAEPPAEISMGGTVTLTTVSDVDFGAAGDAVGEADALAELFAGLEQADVVNKSSKQARPTQVNRIIFSSGILQDQSSEIRSKQRKKTRASPS
jgi:hypothetical protein